MGIEFDTALLAIWVSDKGLRSFLCEHTIRETQLNNLLQYRRTKAYESLKWGRPRSAICILTVFSFSC